jgi:hypothetical protein
MLNSETNGSHFLYRMDFLVHYVFVKVAPMFLIPGIIVALGPLGFTLVQTKSFPNG